MLPVAIAVIMEALNLAALNKYVRELPVSLAVNPVEMPFEVVPVDCTSTVQCPPKTDQCTQSHSEKSSEHSQTTGKPVPQYAHQTDRSTIRYVSTKKGDRARVICSAEFPHVVRQFYLKGPLPSICTTGAEARSYTIDAHLKSEHHNSQALCCCR